MKASDTMFAQSVIAAILCRTSSNPITGPALAAQFVSSLRTITQIIEEARSAGIKIASSEGGFDKYIGQAVEPGYYQARRPEEMRSTYDRYQQRIQKLSTRAKKLMDFSRDNPSLYEQDLL